MDSIRKKIKNDLFFFVLGLFLPVNILFYRIVCKLLESCFVVVPRKTEFYVFYFDNLFNYLPLACNKKSLTE